MNCTSSVGCGSFTTEGFRSLRTVTSIPVLNVDRSAINHNNPFLNIFKKPVVERIPTEKPRDVSRITSSWVSPATESKTKSGAKDGRDIMPVAFNDYVKMSTPTVSENQSTNLSNISVLPAMDQTNADAGTSASTTLTWLIPSAVGGVLFLVVGVIVVTLLLRRNKRRAHGRKYRHVQNNNDIIVDIDTDNNHSQLQTDKNNLLYAKVDKTKKRKTTNEHADIELIPLTEMQARTDTADTTELQVTNDKDTNQTIGIDGGEVPTKGSLLCKSESIESGLVENELYESADDPRFPPPVPVNPLSADNGLDMTNGSPNGHEINSVSPVANRSPSSPSSSSGNKDPDERQLYYTEPSCHDHGATDDQWPSLHLYDPVYDRSQPTDERYLEGGFLFKSADGECARGRSDSKVDPYEEINFDPERLRPVSQATDEAVVDNARRSDSESDTERPLGASLENGDSTSASQKSDQHERPYSSLAEDLKEEEITQEPADYTPLQKEYQDKPDIETENKDEIYEPYSF